jgi:hypothetical protein
LINADIYINDRSTLNVTRGINCKLNQKYWARQVDPEYDKDNDEDDEEDKGDIVHKDINKYIIAEYKDSDTTIMIGDTNIDEDDKKKS